MKRKENLNPREPNKVETIFVRPKKAVSKTHNLKKPLHLETFMNRSSILNGNQVKRRERYGE